MFSKILKAFDVKSESLVAFDQRPQSQWRSFVSRFPQLLSNQKCSTVHINIHQIVKFCVSDILKKDHFRPRATKRNRQKLFIVSSVNPCISVKISECSIVPNLMKITHHHHVIVTQKFVHHCAFETVAEVSQSDLGIVIYTIVL